MAPNTQITITLTPELAEIIHSKARSYEYESDAAYLEDMLADLHDVPFSSQITTRQQLEDALAVGLADIDAGRVMPIEEAFSQICDEFGLSKEFLKNNKRSAS